MRFDIEQVAELASMIASNLKTNKPVGDIDWNPIYHDTVDLADRIAVHTDWDVKPEKLLKDGYPGEEDEEIEYRLNNYKNRTMPYWHKALGETRIIWNSNWSIDWTETNDGFDEGDTPENYFQSQFPLFQSFFTYFKTVVHDEKFNDPNQVIAVEPYAIPLKQIEDVFEVDQTKRVEPYCVLYKSHQVIEYVRGSYLIALTDEKSVISDGQKKQEGLVFKVYDQNTIWKITQTGNKRNWTFTVSQYYVHGWNKLPCRKLEGVINQRRGDVIYLSYFYNAVPSLDIATQQFSTLDLVVKKHAYPVKAYTFDDCHDCSGIGKDLDDKPCGSCKGTGRNVNLSPLKDIQVRLPDRGNPDESPIFPGFQFITPDTEVIKFLDENTKRTAEDAFLAVNINITTKPNGQTATEVKLDQESRHTFFVSFSSELFNLMEFVMDAIGFMRYSVVNSDGSVSSEWVMPVVHEPIEFSMSSASDLVDEIKIAHEANMPDIAITEMVREHLRQRYPSNTRLTKVLDIVQFTDPFVSKSPQDLVMLNATGAVEKWQIVLHNHILKMIQDTPEYMEQEIEDVAADLERRAKEIAGLRNTAENLLNTINGTQ